MFFDHSVLDVGARAAILSALGLVWVLTVVRVIGLRAFSKMTAFDFVVTVAIGSLLAGAAQATDWATFVQALLAMGALLGVQFTSACIRRAAPGTLTLLQNEPVLLMENGIINDAALTTTRVARADLIAKLREADTRHLDRVRAVVLETTGDISVLHGGSLDRMLLDDVRRIGG